MKHRRNRRPLSSTSNSPQHNDSAINTEIPQARPVTLGEGTTTTTATNIVSPVMRDVYIIQQSNHHCADTSNVTMSRSSRSRSNSASSAQPYASPITIPTVTTVTRRVDADDLEDVELGNGSNAFTTHHVIHDDPLSYWANQQQTTSTTPSVTYMQAPGPIVHAERVIIHVTDVQPLSPLSPPPLNVPDPVPPPPPEGQAGQSCWSRLTSNCARCFVQCLETECCQSMMILLCFASALLFVGLFITSILALTDISYYKQKELCPASDCWVFVLMHVLIGTIAIWNHLTTVNDLLISAIWTIIRIIWVFGFAIWGLYELWGISCPRGFERSLLYGVMAVHTYFDFAMLCLSVITILSMLLLPNYYLNL